MSAEAKPTVPATVTVDAGSVALRGGDGSTDLDVRVDGEWFERIKLHRCFPLSEPERYISVLDRDGKELAILDDLANMDVESRSLAARELDRRYFTPEIEHIEIMRQEAGMWFFVVRTQRGPSDFYVRNWRDSAFELSPGRWQITSVDGGRYEIPNVEALDPHSLRLLAQLL